MNALKVQNLSLKYSGGRMIVDQLSQTFEEGKVYSIIGPNGCGKSTLLKALARQLKPVWGDLWLKGKAMNRMSPKEVAQYLSYLAQSQEPVDLKVRSLVRYGRTPHHSIMKQALPEDEKIIEWALQATSLERLADRNVTSLSGGERQRAWIAMSLAQQPKFMLLDEPTTYLDVSHQMEVLELSRNLNKQYGMTIIMVLHDMNHACQFSDEVIVMKEGKIYAQGRPESVMTTDLMKEVFGVKAVINKDEETGNPVCWVKGRYKPLK
ncbi:iron ABC transporter ATP-binding protein [Paenibacillus sp. PK3_47]|uniref:ABC transporter ATP-binding protein n=1 Tax=Paenibacillus sp. PK3_47 TaxID=2072642 RepID=UPI00201DC918|nr:ABC transporter ATP-binding protein [Paenibacillus sp. PK3_47]UQZ37003.1 iron ABC transporter ATP-binding protein [Paenibacillus sp. PK3_47]